MLIELVYLVFKKNRTIQVEIFLNIPGCNFRNLLKAPEAIPNSLVNW